MTRALSISSQTAHRTHFLILTLSLFGAIVSSAAAQQYVEALFSTETMRLPDSPGAVAAATSDTPTDTDGQPATPNLPYARPQVRLITQDVKAPPQTAGDKIFMGLRESVTPFSAIGWLFSAGTSHLSDSRPNYGTNSTAFGQRLGAAAVLSSSRDIFRDSVMGPILHQDTRYYRLGRGHKVLDRTLHAVISPVVGRTDSGRTIPNFANLIGTAGAAGLTQTYYPEQNRSGGDVADIFASSLGGSLVGYLFNEFGGEAAALLELVRTK